MYQGWLWSLWRQRYLERTEEIWIVKRRVNEHFKLDRIDRERCVLYQWWKIWRNINLKYLCWRIEYDSFHREMCLTKKRPDHLSKTSDDFPIARIFQQTKKRVWHFFKIRRGRITCTFWFWLQRGLNFKSSRKRKNPQHGQIKSF